MVLTHYKSVMSGHFSTWMGLLSNGVGLVLIERVLDNTPTPFEQLRKFIAHGCIFEKLRHVWSHTALLEKVCTSGQTAMHRVRVSSIAQVNHFYSVTQHTVEPDTLASDSIGRFLSDTEPGF